MRRAGIAALAGLAVVASCRVGAAPNVATWGAPVILPASGGGFDAEPLTLTDIGGRGPEDGYVAALDSTNAVLWHHRGPAFELIGAIDPGLHVPAADVDLFTFGRVDRPSLIAAVLAVGRGTALTRSDDGGHSWRLLSLRDPGFDRPWLVPGGGPPSSPGALLLVTASSQPPVLRVSRSLDGGATFELLMNQSLLETGEAGPADVVVGRPAAAGYGMALPIVVSAGSGAGGVRQRLELLMLQSSYTIGPRPTAGELGNDYFVPRLEPVLSGGQGAFQGFPVLSDEGGGLTVTYSGVTPGGHDGLRHIWQTHSAAFTGYGKAGPINIDSFTWGRPTRLDPSSTDAVMPAVALNRCGSVVAWLASDGAQPPSWRLRAAFPGPCRVAGSGAFAGTVAARPGSVDRVEDVPAGTVHRGDICLGGQSCLLDRSLLDFISIDAESKCGYAAITYTDDRASKIPGLRYIAQTRGVCYPAGISMG